MAKIRLLANLNCDHVLLLNDALAPGGRILYQDQGRRLGGGGANTGIGLLWAGHEVRVLSRVGQDATGEWILNTAQELGLDVSEVEQFCGATGELLVLVDNQGERTILRQATPSCLPSPLPSTALDCLYVNYQGEAVGEYMADMLSQTLVVSQYPKDNTWLRPCHIMIASAADISAQHQDLWHHARTLAGDSLAWLVVTHGEQGAEAFSATQHLRVPAPDVAVIDATGAGDTFAAGLIHGLLNALPMASALNQASQWAAYALSSSSSIPCTRLKDYLKQ
ncbi:PfkB family carbohydrate kinase [Oceanisphaera avium]|uniref:Carbohydrate kinase n=1 Tax=Oceanisphaera avium TaxID=1903694 RepID=A0A1Y0D0U6_9GAMM|nr:PfkB family carbohydrate kinase [Oceanisphaera avium]ART80757.1 carbohydrate kinase [Oceanisphaera avium]